MENLVGILREDGKDGIVELDRKHEEYGSQIQIPRKFLNGAPFNMKVVVEYKGINSRGKVFGAVKEVLGEEGNPDAAILSIIRYYNLPESFPDAVVDEAKSFGLSLTETQIASELAKGRVDLRHLQTVTIDGEDAKDLDDAIDIYLTEDQKYHLYVHIADVSHYVKEGSQLDQEAQKRGNSIYLVDRVVPMYPPQLSNGICSLNPDQDRFAFTAEMIINQRGDVEKGNLYTSIICSKVRSSYNEAQAIVDGAEVDEDRPDWFKEKILLMDDLTNILQHKRRKRGALQFEFPETKVDLDNAGNPIKIYGEPDLYANHIIESFMIAANEYTGELAEIHKIPIVYRVHELPDAEKLLNFKRLAKKFNIKLRFSDEPTPKELSYALEQLKDKPFGTTLSALLLRSLAKARYTEQNLGHFGLASKNYCHFTAPIRRYSDTITHRNLKLWLAEKKKFNKKAFQRVHNIGDHVSETERIAIDAERESVDQKAAEYYAQRIGEIYHGKISGFSPASLFVELDTTVEGALFYKDLDGYYQYDPDNLVAVNQHNGTVLSLGQDIVVQIAKVDINKRFIDLALVKHQTAEASDGASSKGKPHHASRKNRMNVVNNSSDYETRFTYPGQRKPKSKRKKKSNRQKHKKNRMNHRQKGKRR